MKEIYKKYGLYVVCFIVGIGIGFLICFLSMQKDINEDIKDTYVENYIEEDDVIEEITKEAESINIEEKENSELENYYYNDYIPRIQNLQVGSSFHFGKYEIDNDKSDGKEDIEWIVLYISKNNSIMLVSKDILDTMPYNDEKVYVNWESSTLRKFLNNDFYEDAFNDIEKMFIMENVMSNKQNINYKTDAGPETIDKVFLLSESQANKYFIKQNKEYRIRAARPTEYARQKGCYVADDENEWYIGNAPYWLRTPGIEQNRAATIEPTGEMFIYGDLVSDIETGVRPCIWIKY